MLHRVRKSAVGLWRDESGASLVEYSLLIGVIILVTAAAVTSVGTWASGKWTALLGQLTP
jgi:pilus assembly protein Flp/PilA